MPICPDCQKVYKRSHGSCKAGTCGECLVSFMDLGAHRCPIQRVLGLNLVDTWINEHQKQRVSCWACDTHHFVNKNVHGFRRFCGVDLCWNCYTIPEIARHVKDARRKLFEQDAASGKWCCALCTSTLFDPITFQPLQAFERDHVDVFSKTCTVWELLVTGAPFDQVVRENDKCRNLCVRCHSAVTCAERKVGILRLKSLDPGISSYIKRRALYQVETLTTMLLM
jgi:hypothetical protein